MEDLIVWFEFLEVRMEGWYKFYIVIINISMEMNIVF